jgi:hypothetical protein
MRTDLNKNFQKNKSLNNSMKNPSLLNIDDINKAIELTRFNVSKNIFFYSLNNNIEN